MESKVVSIVVPVYKVENELDRCMQSILSQTHKNIEIILVDDGSPDNCPKLCDEYAKADNRVKVLHKQNGGLSDARNAGLRVATGDYILYVDSDDYIELDACERLLSGMLEGVDFVVGACREVCGEKIRFQKHSNIPEGKIYAARDFAIESIKNNEWYAQAWLNLYNREFLLKNDLFYKVGYLFEDHQILPRLFLTAKEVVYIDYPFYNYIIRENSIMTSTNSPEKVRMSLDIYKEWMDTISKVEDSEYQWYLYGILIRYYLRNCRVRKITGWRIQGMDFRFAWKYALGFKERLKVFYFTLTPHSYIKRH